MFKATLNHKVNRPISNELIMCKGKLYRLYDWDNPFKWEQWILHYKHEKHFPDGVTAQAYFNFLLSTGVQFAPLYDPASPHTYRGSFPIADCVIVASNGSWKVRFE